MYIIFSWKNFNHEYKVQKVKSLKDTYTLHTYMVIFRRTKVIKQNFFYTGNVHISKHKKTAFVNENYLPSPAFVNFYS